MPPRWSPPALRPWHHMRRFFSSDRTVKEHDVILLKQQGDRKPRWRLTPPIRPGKGTIKLHYGATIDHDALLGRHMLDRLVDSSGRNVIVHEASMATHIIHSEKRAVPIYPHDANTIVSMLDLHPERPCETDDSHEPFEVFEAGTGGGSLTMHIARALHAANPTLPLALRKALPTTGPIKKQSLNHINLTHLDLPPDLAAQAESYVSSRRAILHTLDRKALHTTLAHLMIRRFRQGIYLPTVDFHTGSIEEYLSSRLSSRDDRPFLSRVVLDLPSPEDYTATILRAMHVNAMLVVFSPSISQIANLTAWSARGRHPLRLDRVAELPTSTSAEFGVQESEGGRAWNLSTVARKEDGDVVQVMRPRVGDRVAGGGFVAVLRKIPVQEGQEQEAEEVEEGGDERE